MLRTGGALNGGRVVGLRTEPVGEGIGFVGQIARVFLEYDQVSDDAPDTLIAKFAAPLEGGRRTAALLGLYRREVGFYRAFGSDPGIGVARLFFADVTPDGAACLIVLEDLNDGRFGDQVAGCTADEARLALTELARFHARWWNSTSLANTPWLATSSQITIPTLKMAYEPMWVRFRERFQDDLPDSVLEHGPHCGRRVVEILERNASRQTFTLRHSDYRVDNLFFGASEHRPLVVVDWQGALLAWSGAYDAAYLISTGMSIEDRRAHGAELLRTYYDTLVDRGVDDYRFDEFEEDCRGSLLAAFTVIGVIAGGMLDVVNQRSLDLFKSVSERLTTALDDADAWEGTFRS
jgi:hypothetical protein